MFVEKPPGKASGSAKCICSCVYHMAGNSGAKPGQEQVSSGIFYFMPCKIGAGFEAIVALMHRCNTAQYSASQCSAVWYSTLQFS